MYCSKCGKEIHDQAVVCTGCGCAVKQNEDKMSVENSNKQKRESSSTANCALLFAFLIPIVGFIMGIVGCVKYQTPTYKNRCIVAIVLSVVVWLVLFLLMSAVLAM